MWFVHIIWGILSVNDRYYSLRPPSHHPSSHPVALGQLPWLSDHIRPGWGGHVMKTVPGTGLPQTHFWQVQTSIPLSVCSAAWSQDTHWFTHIGFISARVQFCFGALTVIEFEFECFFLITDYKNSPKCYGTFRLFLNDFTWFSHSQYILCPIEDFCCSSFLPALIIPGNNYWLVVIQWSEVMVKCQNYLTYCYLSLQ